VAKYLLTVDGRGLGVPERLINEYAMDPPVPSFPFRTGTLLLGAKSE